MATSDGRALASVTDGRTRHWTKWGPFRQLAVHGVILAASVGIATFLWLRGEPEAMPRGEVVIWTGKPEDIKSILWEADKRKTTILAERDEWGVYYSGRFEQRIDPGDELPSADRVGSTVNQTSEPIIIAQHFVSTKAGRELVNDLAPFKALRAIGRIPKERLAEFGLAPPRWSVVVKFKNGERKLVFGDETAGEKDQYAWDPQQEQVYLVLGDLARDIAEADTRLPDRTLHEWESTIPTSARISTPSGGQRNLVRAGPKDQRFWADSADTTQSDATATNWMAKIDQLHPQVFDPTTDPLGRTLVFRIDYQSLNSKLGFLELWKARSENGQSQYWVKTEGTRLLAVVYGAEAEPVEQDMAAVLK